MRDKWPRSIIVEWRNGEMSNKLKQNEVSANARRNLTTRGETPERKIMIRAVRVSRRLVALVVIFIVSVCVLVLV